MARTPKKKPKKKKAKGRKVVRVSLAPLSYEEAVRGLLEKPKEGEDGEVTA